MQNSTLEQKSFKAVRSRNCPRTWRIQKQSLKRRWLHKQKRWSIFLLFICSVYEKREHIHWERLLTIPHTGSNDKQNIAFPPTYCKSDTQTTQCSPQSLIYSGPRPKIIHRKCNKSTHTVNWSPLRWCHQFFKDTNLLHLQNLILRCSKDRAKFEFVYFTYFTDLPIHISYQKALKDICWIGMLLKWISR